MVRSQNAMSDKDGNWLKFHPALRLTGEGMEPFVIEGSEECVENIFSGARKAAGLYGNEVCGLCTTHNVLRCSSRNGLCNYDEMGNCTYHDKNDPLKESKPCPKGICDKIPYIINKLHRFRRPNFKNTDARKWFENPWEIMKCFIPTDGYENRTNAEDTDASGLLAIVTNCKHFESRVSANLGSPDNAFVKLRDCRNKVFHSPGFNISDRDLQSYMKLMLDVLEDSKFLAHDSEAQEAAEKIREIAESSVHVFCGEEISEQTAETNESEEKHTSTNQEYVENIVRIGRRWHDLSDEERNKSMEELQKRFEERIKNIEERNKRIKDIVVYPVSPDIYRVKLYLERNSKDRQTKFEQLHTIRTYQQTDSSQGAVNATSAVNTSRPKPAIVIVFAKNKTSEVMSPDPTSCKRSNTTSRQMANRMIGDDCKGGGGGTLSGTNDPQRATIKC